MLASCTYVGVEQVLQEPVELRADGASDWRKVHGGCELCQASEIGAR